MKVPLRTKLLTANVLVYITAVLMLLAAFHDSERNADSVCYDKAVRCVSPRTGHGSP